MKHIKTLGLLAVAALALAAVFGTASASANPAEFTASNGGLTIKETTLSPHVFTVTGSEVKCKNINFAGTTSGPTALYQDVHPSYSECEAFGGFPATVTVTNCKLRMTATGEVDLHKTNTDAGSENCAIHIQVNNFFAKCSVTITEQTIPNAVTYTNSGTPPNDDIIVKVNGAANIADHVTESTGFCPLVVGTHTNAHYTGESTVQAEGGSITWDAAKAT